MRRPIVVANWKMYTNLSDALVLATSVRDGTENISGVEMIICPPVIWLTDIAEIIQRKISHLALGAQNIHYLSEGEYTGEISAPMVKDTAKYVIVGHSERRKNFAETNSIVARKVATAIDTGLSPIVCVGEEKKDQNLAGEIVKDLKDSLAHIAAKDYKKLVIAYEPVWAVGAKEPATPEYASKVINQLREVVSAETPIIYGGTVDSSNVYEFVRRPEIDGVLVGRTSLRAKEFIKICRIIEEYKKII